MNNYLVIKRHLLNRDEEGEILEANLPRTLAEKKARELNEDQDSPWQYWAVSEQNFKQSFSDEENQK